MKVKMPFKLRLRKTRQYNVLSRNVLVISVELLDKTTLECTLSADSTGQDCLHNVCQRLSLHQPEFFGLRYMSKKPYPKVRWVELERPLRKQLDKYAQSPALALAVLYYIHDVSLLQDDVTRSHYFLQVKQDVLEGKLRCNHEKAVLSLPHTAYKFGDHQPDRHTAEYLKDFMLFPKQVGGEGEVVGGLVEAVVWQYSSLQSLAQALAETYYILEAQQLDGYGQETFMARDERGSEVYLGTSLMGIDVRPAAGHTHSFYRWNDITNLVNNKRNFGIECQRTDETVHFSFDEPDAAKYVWKMCVKQHTFFKRNQEVLEGGSGGPETRSLAIPDLQSSVMAPHLHHSHHLSTSHDMLDSGGGLGELTLRSSGDPGALASYSTTLPHFDLSYIHQSAESSGHLNPGVETSTSQIMSDPSYGLLSQSAYSLNTTHHPQQNQVVLASHSQVQQPSNMPPPTQPPPQPKQPPQQPKPPPQQPQQQPPPQQQQTQQQHDAAGQQLALYSSNLSLPSTRGSFRRSLLPQYRPTPDYDTALVQKYGPGINPLNFRATVLCSSQPEISNTHEMTGGGGGGGGGGGLGSYSHYKGYTDLSQHPDTSIPQLSRSAGILMPGLLHNTYSTPELASPSSGDLMDEVGGGSRIRSDHDILHVYKPPPPYPYNKPSSNSTPDLASATQGEDLSPDLASRRRALLTASLGCLGSPDLSRTYENLADLSEAVESLRHELTRTTDTSDASFLAPLHPCGHNFSRNDLDAIYQLSEGRVTVGTNLNLNPVFAAEQTNPAQKSQQPQYQPGYQFTASQYPEPQYATGSGQSTQEPIYQNISALRTEEARERTRSAPEIDNKPIAGVGGGVGPVQKAHLINQLPGEDVQGARSRALSQPVRQTAIEPQLYIENRLGEQQQQQQQRGPIEALNTAMGQIPVFSAQQELRHNHHQLLHLQQQMQALSLQQIQLQQQKEQHLQLQQQKEQHIQLQQQKEQHIQLQQQKEQHIQLQQQKEQQLQQLQLQQQQKKEQQQHLQQQLQVHQQQQQQSAQKLSQSAHHLQQIQHQVTQQQRQQQQQQQTQEQQRQQLQEQHRQQQQQQQQQDQQRQHQIQIQQQQQTPQKPVQQQQQQTPQKPTQQQQQTPQKVTQQQQQQTPQKPAQPQQQQTPQKPTQQQQQLRQPPPQGVTIAQQIKPQQRESASSAETSGLKLSPRKKWGASPSAGPSVLVAGQPEATSSLDRPRWSMQEGGTGLDFFTVHEPNQSRTREASLENLVSGSAGPVTSQRLAASSDSLASSQGSGRGNVSEGVRSVESNKQPTTPTTTTAKVSTPDVLKGATSKKSNDPRAVQLETRLVKGDVVKEFESLPRSRPNAAFTTATRQDNLPRNRYKDIIPYEDNRVKITPTKDNKSGYINASHITASIGESQRFYICCQGPLPNTVGHFWQCVWEADVYLVVMLTSVTGDTATSKSFPYWPQTDNTSVECGQFRVWRKHSTVSGSHVTSRLQVVEAGSRKSRTIWHLQYTDWADQGCPDHINGFISFLEEMSTLRRYTYQEVRGVGRNRNTPVLVHCSAGVGRSGVTVLCDLLLEASDHNLPLDPPKVLSHLRQQRMALVQTVGQYRFVYQVIVAYLNRARLI